MKPTPRNTATVAAKRSPRRSSSQTRITGTPIGAGDPCDTKGAIEEAFPEADYATVTKIYAAEPTGRYSPPRFVGEKTEVIKGNPNPRHISTSFVERNNLTMRMQMRRFTRLTNGFSKKAENHAHAVSLNFLYYNFARIHQTLRITPAMAAGLSDHVWSIEEIVGLLDVADKKAA
jgi:hypothetical protein